MESGSVNRGNGSVNRGDPRSNIRVHIILTDKVYVVSEMCKFWSCVKGREGLGQGEESLIVVVSGQ